MSACICLSLRTHAPFHWFNRYAYSKLSVSASCQLDYIVQNVSKSLNVPVKSHNLYDCILNLLVHESCMLSNLQNAQQLIKV